MYNDAGVLQIDAFGEQVGGDEQADALVGWGWRATLAERGEVCQDVLPRDGSAGDPSPAP